MSPISSSAPATDAVVESLGRAIIRGEFEAGARLPAERDLAVRLGASRPTLREALRRLSEWGLVEAHRGAGVLVRSHTDWSIEVTPLFLRHVNPDRFGITAGEFLRSLLALRRGLLAATIPLIAHRLSPVALHDARKALDRAWESRGTARFAEADLEVMKTLVTASAELPALWLLNRISGMYLELGRQWAVDPGEAYKEGLGQFLSGLEAGDAEAATHHLIDYLERSDARLLQLFGIKS